MALPQTGIATQFITSVGGHMGITQFQGSRAPEWGNASPTGGASHADGYFPLRNVRVSRPFFNEDVTQSDSFGGQQFATAALGGMFTAECVYTPEADMEYSLLNYYSANFNLGVRVQLLVGDALAYAGVPGAYPEFYYIPSCKIALGERIQDAGNKKFTVQKVTGLVNGRMYLLPAEWPLFQQYIANLTLWQKVF